jgi:hypothetical protein
MGREYELKSRKKATIFCFSFFLGLTVAATLSFLFAHGIAEFLGPFFSVLAIIYAAVGLLQLIPYLIRRFSPNHF